MKKTISNKIEGFGLFLILASFCWQLIENEISEIQQETRFFRLETKLDNIWMVYHHDYAQRHPKDSVYGAIDFKYFVKNWKIYGENLEVDYNIQKSLSYHSNIRIAIFIIGSLLLIVPKFYD